MIALLALQPGVEPLGSPAQALVIAAGAKLRLINGVSVIAKFDGEHNAMPTPEAAQAALLAIATSNIVPASGPRWGGDGRQTVEQTRTIEIGTFRCAGYLGQPAGNWWKWRYETDAADIRPRHWRDGRIGPPL